VIAALAGYGATLAAQNANSTAKPAAAAAAKPASTPAKAASSYKVPRTADGVPDFQGFWTNATLTPLQRPNGVTAEYVTKDEFEKRVAQRVAQDEEQTTPGTTGDVHYDFTQFGLDKTQSKITTNGYRTSLIVDPPDGKIPPQTPEGQKRNQALAAERKQQGALTDRVQNMALGTRCIITNDCGPPLMDAGYNANYQIVQSKENVLLLTEMIHDARIIPISNSPAPPKAVTSWMGESRGHWEGNTLVVETTNIRPGAAPLNMATLGGPRNNTIPMSPEAKVVERFTLINPDTMTYEMTYSDPKVWTAPFTLRVDWPRNQKYEFYEYACHEGDEQVRNFINSSRAARGLKTSKVGSPDRTDGGADAVAAK
jgi:hypothetical protein